MIYVSNPVRWGKNQKSLFQEEVQDPPYHFASYEATALLSYLGYETK